MEPRKGHRVVRISPRNGWNTCSICGRPAVGGKVGPRKVSLRHSTVPVPVVGARS